MLPTFCKKGNIQHPIFFLVKFAFEGKCHEVFRLQFFHKTASSYPDVRTSKVFRILSNVCGVVQICNDSQVHSPQGNRSGASLVRKCCIKHEF